MSGNRMSLSWVIQTHSDLLCQSVQKLLLRWGLCYIKMKLSLPEEFNFKSGVEFRVKDIGEWAAIDSSKLC